MKVRAFISYKSEDSEQAEMIGAHLRDNCIDVWLDLWKISAGIPITQAVNAGLQESDIVVVLLSKESIESKWVEREWSSKYGEELRSGKILVIPVCIEPPRDLRIPALLADKKYICLLQEERDEALLELRSAVMSVCFPVDFDLRIAFLLGFNIVQFAGLSASFPNTENYHIMKGNVEKAIQDLRLKNMGEWWLGFSPPNDPFIDAISKAHGPTALSAYRLGNNDMSLSNICLNTPNPESTLNQILTNILDPKSVRDRLLINIKETLTELGMVCWLVNYRQLIEEFQKNKNQKIFKYMHESLRLKILQDLGKKSNLKNLYPGWTGEGD